MKDTSKYIAIFQTRKNSHKKYSDYYHVDVSENQQIWEASFLKKTKKKKQKHLVALSNQTHFVKDLYNCLFRKIVEKKPFDCLDHITTCVFRIY